MGLVFLPIGFYSSLQRTGTDREQGRQGDGCQATRTIARPWMNKRFLSQMQKAVLCSIPGSKIRDMANQSKTNKGEKNEKEELKCRRVRWKDRKQWIVNVIGCNGVHKVSKPTSLQIGQQWAPKDFLQILLWLVGFYVSGAETWIPSWRNPH